MLDGLENASVEMEEAKVCLVFSQARGKSGILIVVIWEASITIIN